MRKNLILTLLLGSMLVASGVAATPSGTDPVIAFENSSKLEIDLKVMIDDFLPALLESIEDEDEDGVAMVNFFLEQLGLDALQLLKMESKQSKDKSSSKVVITLDPEKSESLLYQFFTTPNAQCGFGKYVPKDELVMFMTMHNFSSYLETIMDFLSKPEMAQYLGDMPIDENGDIVLGEFNPRRDLLPLLSGELDVFVLESESTSYSPLGSPLFLALGSSDGFALRDKILEIGMMFGADISGMLDSVEAENINGFEFKEFPFGGALAISEDYLVIAMEPNSLRELLTTGKGSLKVPEGIEWVYLDGPKYGVYMDSLMEMTAGMASEQTAETDLMMKVYSILFEYIETEEVLVKSSSNSIEIRTKVNGQVISGLYELAYVMLQELPQYLETQRLEEEAAEMDEYWQAIDVIDKAMMAYADDHDGAYPEYPEDLVLDGYLDYFPLLGPIAGGEYEDWCYTYYLLRNEHGVPEGYFLFLYGDGDNQGFDVFTSENLLDIENFQIGRDGDQDGVSSFCYDGTALDQMDVYWEE